MSLAVKSVSGESEAAHSFTISRPVTSTSFVKGGVWNTRMSLRAERGLESWHSQNLVLHRWSVAPWNISVPCDEHFHQGSAQGCVDRTSRWSAGALLVCPRTRNRPDGSSTA